MRVAGSVCGLVVLVGCGSGGDVAGTAPSPATCGGAPVHGPRCSDASFAARGLPLADVCEYLAREAGAGEGAMTARVEMTACHERARTRSGPCSDRRIFRPFTRCEETVARAHIVSCRRDGREVATTYNEVLEYWLLRPEGCWEHHAMYNPYRSYQGVLVDEAERPALIERVRGGGRLIAEMRLEGSLMRLPIEIEPATDSICNPALTIVEPPSGLSDLAGRSTVHCGELGVSPP